MSGYRPFVDNEHVRNITFSDAYIAEMEQTLSANDKLIPEFWQKKYRKDQGTNWDIFYRRNGDRFFKDRTYLEREFMNQSLSEDLSSERYLNTDWVFLDIGCGVGNSLFPLFDRYKTKCHAYAFDVSKNAISHLKDRYTEYVANSEHRGDLVCCGEWDLLKTDNPTTNYTPSYGEHEALVFNERTPVNLDGVADVGMLMFVLSALPPECLSAVVNRIATKFKSGALLFFRDYGKYDAKELRFSKNGGSKLSDGLYVRQDGTLANFFSKATVDALMIAAGFEVISSENITRQMSNRKTGESFNRCWLQGIYRKM